jgi:hypothetical protein
MQGFSTCSIHKGGKIYNTHGRHSWNVVDKLISSFLIKHMAEKHTKSNVSRNFALKVAILLQSQPFGGGGGGGGGGRIQTTNNDLGDG